MTNVLAVSSFPLQMYFVAPRIGRGTRDLRVLERSSILLIVDLFFRLNPEAQPFLDLMRKA